VKAGDFLDRESDDEEDEAKWRATVEEIDSSDEEGDAIEAAQTARDALRASQPFFPDVVASIDAALAELGGSVFPSLDFRAPTDATWITTERVARCQTIGEILLLLKSSDKVQKELEEPFEHCTEPESAATAASATEPSSASAASSSTPPSTAATPFTPTLALRKWSTLHPSKLFRVFVWRRTLLALCQLDPNFYEFLQKDEWRDEAQDAIEAWLEDDIAPALGKIGLENYVMDVYLDLNERVWLVKLKPFWPKATRAVLFSWKEIYEFAMDHDEQEEKKQLSKTSGASSITAASSTSAPSAGGWPSTASLSVPFRVIPSAAAGMDILRTMDTMSTRFPVEGFDVSDSAAIERWIQRVEEGDLKQK
jgi:hypothetical protein